MTKKSRQKFKYFENRESFWGEIKSIFALHITKLYLNSRDIYQQVKFNNDKFLHILITRIL